jgi:1A family penicillin-binding protein
MLGAATIAVFAVPLPLPDSESACRVFDRFGKEIGILQTEYRRPIQLKYVPNFFRQAVLAVEDHNFYKHGGFSPRGMIRAAIYDLREKKASQGGSTITQQLAKNLYLSRDRTLIRKIKEAVLALRLELHYSKDQIFESYINQVYFGHGSYGLNTASQTYFGREPTELNRKEQALLAGLPKGPAFYTPYRNRKKAENRIAIVLTRMVETNVLTPEEAEEIKKEPLRLPGINLHKAFAPFYLDFVRYEASRILQRSPEEINWDRLRIETAMDPDWQRNAEEALQKGLANGHTGDNGVSQPQGAFVALEPATGAIRALVGGTDYAHSPFNRATDARRQPGSAFKPFLYLAALEDNYCLSSVVSCEKLEIRSGRKIYSPKDHGAKSYHGRSLRLREALAKSCNVVAVRLHEQLGREKLVQMAQRLGISSPLPAIPSLPLGTAEVTPLELAGAYCALNNGGHSVKPWAIRRILDRNGRILFEVKPEPHLVVDPKIAYLVTSALQDTIRIGGTAPSVGSSLSFPVAGKTGTSQSSRDAWFVGYTPYVTAVVYVGNDQNQRLSGGGGQLAAPIWTKFAQQIHRDLPARDFPIPLGIITADICRETGLLATPFCPRTMEHFIAGAAPSTYCSTHRRFIIRVCSRTGLLPGPYCQDTEEREFNWGEHPTASCHTCHKRRSLWDWFFRRPKSTKRPKIAPPVEDRDFLENWQNRPDFHFEYRKHRRKRETNKRSYTDG